MRKIDRIFGLISKLLGNILKSWEHFTNLLSCRKFFSWKAKIIPQKRKFVYFFWIFFHLNYEIYKFFLINWIFLGPTVGTISSSMSEIFPTISLEKFTTDLYFRLSDYFRKNVRKIFYSVLIYYIMQATWVQKCEAAVGYCLQRPLE